LQSTTERLDRSSSKATTDRSRSPSKAATSNQPQEEDSRRRPTREASKGFTAESGLRFPGSDTGAPPEKSRSSLPAIILHPGEEGDLQTESPNPKRKSRHAHTVELGQLQSTSLASVDADKEMAMDGIPPRRSYRSDANESTSDAAQTSERVSGVDPEALAAFQSEATQKVAEVQFRLEASVTDLQAKMTHQLDAVTRDLRLAEEKQRVDSDKVIRDVELQKGSTSTNFKDMNGELKQLSQKLLELEMDESTTNGFRELHRQAAELRENVAQAAVAQMIEPKMDRLAKDVDLLTKSCSKSDKELGSATKSVSQLFLRIDSCSQQLLQVPLRRELDDRCVALDQQCRSVSSLLTEVQFALHDVSNAIVSLGTKAEQADLAIIRDELSMFAETVKDNKESVLFGARCLSCNRVFDEVGQEAGVVDLPVERQRDALFSQVQHALHSPNMDPMAKIKMLAIKVGRPMPILKNGNTFSGRDTSSFACGTGDMQLMPAVRGSSMVDASSPQRPSTTPRTQKRRPKGEWQGSPKKDGPMDFIHPLSELLDRGHR